MKFKKLLSLSLLIAGLTTGSSSFAIPMPPAPKSALEQAARRALSSITPSTAYITAQAKTGAQRVTSRIPSPKDVWNIHKAKTIVPKTVNAFATATTRLKQRGIANDLQSKMAPIKEALSKDPKDVAAFTTFSESVIKELENIKGNLLWYKNPLDTAVVANELRILRNKKAQLEETLKFLESPEGIATQAGLDKVKGYNKWLLLVQLVAVSLATKEITDIFADLKDWNETRIEASNKEKAARLAAEQEERLKKEAIKREKAFLKTPFNWEEEIDNTWPYVKAMHQLPWETKTPDEVFWEWKKGKLTEALKQKRLGPDDLARMFAEFEQQQKSQTKSPTKEAPKPKPKTQTTVESLAEGKQSWGYPLGNWFRSWKTDK